MHENTTPSFDGESDDDHQRAVYEFVERHGTATRAEVLQSVRVNAGPTHSKPARSGRYTQETTLSPTQLEACLDSLVAEGWLTEREGTLHVSLPGAPTERETDAGRLRIRRAQERDRTALLETMRAVAADGSYVVAADLATRLERAPALVRVNGTEDGAASRVCFVAVLDDDDDADTTSGEADGHDDRSLVGWLHLDTPALESRSHTAEVTVGVDPDNRRQGIGQALLEYGLEWAGEAGYRKLVQGVPATNEEAVAFLSEWDREGERVEHYQIDGEYVDEVLFAAWPTVS
ncbi:N-acetyltransferase GCN5 [Natrialba chahannaoensis JCM 10990]|uniref:N-acetyltransferase GCN5 n=1 Tax=Natrialba chahannaoensis JCM 10990 TaxID=1227492 RepID=M0A4U0_9EURY|nr:GNAT family N-acetyltransferase [Natrialba chahannaoensis]ELY93559.1 N-acetyltransferase GCN5 [Natrialba chahannaoensis JCM 10990]